MDKGLKDKLDLFTDLSEEERTKVEDKFMPALAYVEYDELERALSFLRSQNVYITKAREVKVMTLENFVKKFDILSEVQATDLYSQNPEALIWDALDLFKKIKYCIQAKHDYKNIDGTYKSFLFNAKEWGQEFSQNTEITPENESIVKADIAPVEVTLDDPLDINRYRDVMAATNHDLEDLNTGISRYEAIKANIDQKNLDENYTRRTMENELGLSALDSMSDSIDSTPLDSSKEFGMPNDGYTPIKSNDEDYISFDDSIDDLLNTSISANDIIPDEFTVNSGRGR